MHVKNVPVLDLRYWIAILLASIMGTAFGDFISGDLKFGFAGGLLTLSAVIAAIFIAERHLKWHTVIWYWAAIEATRMAATNLGDFLSTTLRLGNGLVAAMLAVLLALFLFVTRRAPGSNDWTRRKSLPETNPRYWAAILIASTLGTTLGDFVSGDLGLGLRLGSLVLGTLLAVVVTIELQGRTASEPRYWVAIAVARTSGTIMGDYMTSERGLNFGCAWGASLAFILLVGVLIFPGSLLVRVSEIIDGPAVTIIDGMGGYRAVQVPVASSLFGRCARLLSSLACGPFRSLSSLYGERERPSAIGCAACELMRQAGAGFGGR